MTGDDAPRLMEFWHAVELFSPPEVPKPGICQQVVELRPGAAMPWEPGSATVLPAARKDQVWRHEIFGGIYELSRVQGVLVQAFGDKAEADLRQPAKGESALFACRVDTDGLLIDGSAALSACAWAVGRALARKEGTRSWLAGFRAEAAKFGTDLAGLARLRDDDEGVPDDELARGQTRHPLTAADLAELAAGLAARLGVATRSTCPAGSTSGSSPPCCARASRPVTSRRAGGWRTRTARWR